MKNSEFLDDDNLIFRKNNRKHHSPYFKKKKIEKTIKDNFIPFNIYFWIHGVGFEQGLRYFKRKSFQSLLSYILFVFFNGNFAITTIAEIHNYLEGITKDDFIKITCYLFELWLRISMCIKRKKFNKMIQRLSTIYTTTVISHKVRIKYKLLIILLIVDLGRSFMTMFYFFMQIPAFWGKDYVNMFSLSFVANSSMIYYTSIFIRNYSILSPSIILYFCCFVFIVEKILLDVRKKMHSTRPVNTEILYEAYEEISNFVSELNDVFTSMLLISFTVLLQWVFVETYPLVFNKMNSSTELYICFFTLTYNFIFFVIPCLFASSLSKSASDVKQDLYNLPFDVSKTNRLPFVLNVQNKFVGITLLDDIVIGKSLILTAVGTLVTYGIMIATFKANASDNRNI